MNSAGARSMLRQSSMHVLSRLKAGEYLRVEERSEGHGCERLRAVMVCHLCGDVVDRCSRLT
jgi:hypothetical protein